MKSRFLILGLLPLMVGFSPVPRQPAPVDDLHNDMFASRRGTFSAFVSQRAESVSLSARETLAPLLPIEGVAERGGRKALLMRGFTLWEGESIPGTMIDVYDRLYSLRSVDGNVAVFSITGTRPEDSLELRIPFSLRDPLILPLTNQ